MNSNRSKITSLRFAAAIVAALLLFSTSAQAQLTTLPQASPAASVSQTIGITNVTVSYSRPNVAGREIWGKLVPYGLTDLGWAGATAAPWRAGANENTVISFEHDATVEGQPIAAGDYGLHLIVEESGEVTVILSHDSQSWGSYFYNPDADALRVKVMSEEAPFEEQLCYRFSKVSKNAALLSLNWEKKTIPIQLAVDTDSIVLASLKTEMSNAHSFRYQNLMDAANYLLVHDMELELALEWSDIAINRPFVGRKVPETLELKAKILDKLGRANEAAKVRAEIETL